MSSLSAGTRRAAAASLCARSETVPTVAVQSEAGGDEVVGPDVVGDFSGADATSPVFIKVILQGRCVDGSAPAVSGSEGGSEAAGPYSVRGDTTVCCRLAWRVLSIGVAPLGSAKSTVFTWFADD